MTPPRAEARLWRLLARVRELRVRRRHAALARAERYAHEAAAEVAARETICDAHARQLPLVLRGCAHGSAAAAVWRQALARHQIQAAQFDREVARACARHSDASAAVRTARAALHRDMLARDDAQRRAREIDYALRDEA